MENSIYTITIAGVNHDGRVSDYSERCAAVMAAVYSGRGQPYAIVSIGCQFRNLNGWCGTVNSNVPTSIFNSLPLMRVVVLNVSKILMELPPQFQWLLVFLPWWYKPSKFHQKYSSTIWKNLLRCTKYIIMITFKSKFNMARSTALDRVDKRNRYIDPESWMDWECSWILRKSRFRFRIAQCIRYGWNGHELPTRRTNAYLFNRIQIQVVAILRLARYLLIPYHSISNMHL